MLQIEVINRKKESIVLECLPALSVAENRESFFKEIAQLFPTLSKEYKAIKEAYEVAELTFLDKKREDNITPYFNHLHYAALIVLYLQVTDHEVIIFTLLHDICEDYPKLWPLSRLKEKFGERVAYLVECGTKPPIKKDASDEEKKERDHRHYCRFCHHPREFFIGILSERLHNVLTLGACSPEKRKRKIDETRRYYMPFAADHIILFRELKEALENAERL